MAALVLLLCPFTGFSNPPPEHTQPNDLPHPQNVPCMLSPAQASLCLPGDTAPLHPPLTAHQGLPNHPSGSFDFQTGDAQHFPKVHTLSDEHCRTITSYPTSCKWSDDTSPAPAAAARGDRALRTHAQGLLPTLRSAEAPCSIEGGSAGSFCTSLTPTCSSADCSELQGQANVQPWNSQRQSAGKTGSAAAATSCICLDTEQPASHVSLQ